MTEHLDNERISRNLLGAPDDADREHLAVCAECRSEVEGFERALRGMRGAVREWSDAEYASPGAPRPRLIARPVLTVAWSMAVLLAVILMRPIPQAPPVISAADSELMDQVRADLARPVPMGMEALLPPVELQP
jgi:hypothetical protein